MRKILIFSIALISAISTGICSGKPESGPTEVINLDNPALQPEQIHEIMSFSSGTHVQRKVIYQVPLNKRFVLEHISAYYATTDGSISMRAIIEVSETSNCPSFPKFRHILQVPQLTQTSPTIYNYIVSQPMRLYVEPEDYLCIHLNRSGDFNTRDVEVLLSGYLVDLPQ